MSEPLTAEQAAGILNHGLDELPRAREALEAIADGAHVHSTLDIIRRAKVCAVNSCVAELRAQGHKIRCWSRKVRDARVWFYKLA